MGAKGRGWKIRKCSFITKDGGSGSSDRAVTFLRYYSSVAGREGAGAISALLLSPSRDCVCYLHFPVILCFHYVQDGLHTEDTSLLSLQFPTPPASSAQLPKPALPGFQGCIPAPMSHWPSVVCVSTQLELLLLASLALLGALWCYCKIQQASGMQWQIFKGQSYPKAQY